MPIYAYKCSACGHAQDVLQKMSDPLLTVCPECEQATYIKQVTAAGFQLKGSGWYVTDFRNNNGASTPGASAPGTPVAGAPGAAASVASDKPAASSADSGSSAAPAATNTAASAPAPTAPPPSSTPSS